MREPTVERSVHIESVDPHNLPFIDETGKLVTTTSLSRFEGRFSYDTNDYFWEVAANTNGTVTYLSDQNAVSLDIAGAQDDELIRISNRLFFYNPDTVVRIAGAITFQNDANLQSFWGLFSYLSGAIQDGYLLRSRANNIEFVKVSSVSGTPVETILPRAQWDDPMDGTGPSGLNLDFSVQQMVEIRHVWYGGGPANLFFRVNGIVYYAAQFKATNVAGNTDPIIANPVLAGGYGIKALGAIPGGASLKHVGLSVTANGGEKPTGIPYSVESPLVTASGGAWTPLLTIQPKLTFKGKPNVYGYISFLQFTLFTEGRDATFALVRNATLTGAVFADIPDIAGAGITDSMVEYDVTASAITGGVPIYPKALPGGSHAEITIAEQDLISVNATGTTTNAMTLVVRPSAGGNANVRGSAAWREVY